MQIRTVLYADDGMVFTNGLEFGKIIYLANGIDPSMYYQITEEEYNSIVESELCEMLV